MDTTSQDYLHDLGRKLTIAEVATLFEVEVTTVKRHYTRYGGVMLGRKLLFFEKLVSRLWRDTMPHKQKVREKVDREWFGQIKQHGSPDRKVFPTKDAAKAWEVEMKREKTEKCYRREESEETPMICLLEWAEKYLDYSQWIQPQDLQ